VCGDFDDVDNFGDCAAEIVHASSKYKTSTAYTRGTSALNHPVHTHTLNHSDGIFSNFVPEFAEFKFFRETVDQVLWQDGQNAISRKRDSFVERFEGATKLEHIDLEGLAGLRRQGVDDIPGVCRQNQ
jgi:hypothetical protein